MDVRTAFISAGGNRHPSAADWDSSGSGTLAFGSSSNVALWQPLDAAFHGISSLLKGHNASVSAVRFLHSPQIPDCILLSASVDGCLKAWRRHNELGFVECSSVQVASKAVNAIAVLPNSDLIVTATATAELQVWKLHQDPASPTILIELLQILHIPGKFFALAIALSRLPSTDAVVLAAAGTRSTVQLFVSSAHGNEFAAASVLTGHEGWVRDLSFVREHNDPNSDLLLASAGQDKYIRLWRVHAGQELPAPAKAANDPALGGVSRSLSNKAHRLVLPTATFSVTFEALLLGHEDWIYTAKWAYGSGHLKLLSASADNSLAIWELDSASGLWVSSVRLGELISQKGATTATGSTGGFWIGLWSPDADSVVSLGRTGSWRLWTHDTASSQWSQSLSITGHTREVRDIAWSAPPSYVLSTSADQTTRLFSPWWRGDNLSWHEFSRPQIHGYDLNCIDVLSPTSFVSGADEKLLRVFSMPRGVSTQLARLSDFKLEKASELPDAANLSVLGLSNKAIDTSILQDRADTVEGDEEELAAAETTANFVNAHDVQRPPLEDHLSRHLLWPETEKLYGHGYEISALAANHKGSLIATACRASSLDHAVIRLFEASTWQEIKPPLAGHSLTVTRMSFSPDDRFLLSVGRDRQCAVFRRSEQNDTTYELLASNPKAHSRMILDCTWAPLEDATQMRIFASAGRDKCVRFWELADKAIAERLSVEEDEPVTAVDILGKRLDGHLVLAMATESGAISVLYVDKGFNITSKMSLPDRLCLASPISRVLWKPNSNETGQHGSLSQLAVASQDSSMRIFSITLNPQISQ